jgi:hypothetical protein
MGLKIFFTVPSPWQLRNKILIKNKKMMMEPSVGPIFYNPMDANEETISNHGGRENMVALRRDSSIRSGNQHRSRSCSYDGSTTSMDGIDDDEIDLDEFIEDDDGDAEIGGVRDCNLSRYSGIPIIQVIIDNNHTILNHIHVELFF